jgi:hypothetical protein
MKSLKLKISSNIEINNKIKNLCIFFETSTIAIPTFDILLKCWFHRDFKVIHSYNIMHGLGKKKSNWTFENVDNDFNWFVVGMPMVFMGSNSSILTNKQKKLKLKLQSNLQLHIRIILSIKLFGNKKQWSLFWNLHQNMHWFSAKSKGRLVQ